jgi:hypothetical protein
MPLSGGSTACQLINNVGDGSQLLILKPRQSFAD